MRKRGPGALTIGLIDRARAQPGLHPVFFAVAQVPIVAAVAEELLRG